MLKYLKMMVAEDVIITVEVRVVLAEDVLVVIEVQLQEGKEILLQDVKVDSEVIVVQLLVRVLAEEANLEAHQHQEVADFQTEHRDAMVVLQKGQPDVLKTLEKLLEKEGQEEVKSSPLAPLQRSGELGN
jgi:hypothetical protein